MSRRKPPAAGKDFVAAFWAQVRAADYEARARKAIGKAVPAAGGLRLSRWPQLRRKPIEAKKPKQ